MIMTAADRAASRNPFHHVFFKLRFDGRRPSQIFRRGSQIATALYRLVFPYHCRFVKDQGAVVATDFDRFLLAHSCLCVVFAVFVYPRTIISQPFVLAIIQ